MNTGIFFFVILMLNNSIGFPMLSAITQTKPVIPVAPSPLPEPDTQEDADDGGDDQPDVQTVSTDQDQSGEAASDDSAATDTSGQAEPEAEAEAPSSDDDQAEEAEQPDQEDQDADSPLALVLQSKMVNNNKVYFLIIPPFTETYLTKTVKGTVSTYSMVDSSAHITFGPLMLSNPSIALDSDTSKITITLTIAGSGLFSFPAKTLSGSYVQDDVTGIAGLSFPLSHGFDLGPFSFTTNELVFSADKSVNLLGKARLYDYDMNVGCEILKDINDKITINLTAQTDQVIYPFKELAKIEVPSALSNISITGTTVSLLNLGKKLSADARLSLKGTAQLFGKSADVEIVKAKAGSTFLISLGNLGISTIIPETKGSALDQFAFNNAYLIITEAGYVDAARQIDAKQGVTLKAEMAAPAELKKLVSTAPSNIIISGTLRKNIKDMYLTASIPCAVKLTSKAEFKDIEIKAGGLPPSVSFLTVITVQPSAHDDQLVFTSRIAAEAKEAKIAGTMQGFWKNPLGVKGLAIGNLALELGIVYGSPVPTLFGITGDMKVGSQEAAVAAKISAVANDTIISGKLSEFGIRDLFAVASDLAKAVGKSIPSKIINVIPEIGLTDAEITIAPSGGTIGEIQFEQGLTVKGKMDVLGHGALVDISVSSQGIVAQGTMDKLVFGPLEIAGKGLSGKEAQPSLGTSYGGQAAAAQSGPAVSLHVTLQDQSFFLTGLVSLMWIKDEIEIHLGTNQLAFKLSGKLYGMFQAEVGVNGHLGKDEDFIINAELASDFHNALLQQVEAELKDIKKLVHNNASIDQNDLFIKGDCKKLLTKVFQDYSFPASEPILLASLTSKFRKTIHKAEETATHVESGVQNVAKKGEEDVAHDAKKAEGAVQNVAQKVEHDVDKLEDLVSIKKATLAFSTRALLKGAIPRLTLDLVIMGKDESFSIDCDLKDVEHGFTDSFAQLKKLIKAKIHI